MAELNTEYLAVLHSDRVQQAVLAERKRIMEIINRQSSHAGKTHYFGSNCMVCRIFEEVDQ